MMYAQEEIPIKNNEIVKNLEPVMMYAYEKIPVQNNEVANDDEIETNDDGLTHSLVD